MKKNLKLVFVSPVFEDDKNEKYSYRLFFSENPDVVWGNSWDYENPGIISSTDIDEIYPQAESYSETEDIKSDYRLGLAMKNTCYPLLYCIYGILALAWIDIEWSEEYPEQGRGVLKFGMDYDEVHKIIQQYKKIA
jgi:hypothetical protein